MTSETTDRMLDRPREAEDVSDTVIEELNEALPTGDDADLGERGFDGDRGNPEDAPFNLGLPAPRAIDLRKLWKLAGKSPDPMIKVAANRRAILLSHGVTALPRPGRKPARVWGLGYKVELFDVAADTVGIEPTTDLLNIVTVGSEATVDIGLDGSMEVPKVVRDAISTVPGVSLTAAKVGASIAENAKLSITFTLSVPRIISGPGDGYGGAEWNLYAQDRRLEGHQALLQTLLVPKNARSLHVGITSWVREAGLFGPKQWVFETATFTVDLDA